MADDQFPPPSADPGDDPEQILRDIRQQRPKLTCLGVVLVGTWALAGMAGLGTLLVYVVRRLHREVTPGA